MGMAAEQREQQAVVDKTSIRDSDDDDDDDDNVDGSGSSGKRVSTKNARRKPRKCKYTVHSKSLTAKEKDAELAKLAQVHFAASSANGLKWQKAGSNVYRRKLNGDVQQMKCALASSNCCEYRLRVVQKRDCGDRCFEIHLWNWEHADHKTMRGKVGPAPAVRQMMTPLHLDSRPGTYSSPTPVLEKTQYMPPLPTPSHPSLRSSRIMTSS